MKHPSQAPGVKSQTQALQHPQANPTMPRRIDRYYLLEHLGKEAPLEIYLAYDSSLERQVTLYVCHPKARGVRAQRASGLLEGAKRLAQVRHRHVAQVFDVGTAPNGSIYVSVQRIEGTPLGERLHDRKVSDDRWLDYMIQIGRGLKSMHRQRTVHGQLGLDRCFLGDDKIVCIQGFKLYEEQAISSRDQEDEWKQKAARDCEAWVRMFEHCMGLSPSSLGNAKPMLRAKPKANRWVREIHAAMLNRKTRGGMDLQEILERLEAARERRDRIKRTRWMAVPSLVGLCALAVVASRPKAPAEEFNCEFQAESIAEVWNIRSQSAIREHFYSLHKTRAPLLWETSEKRLAKWAQDWKAAKYNECEGKNESAAANRFKPQSHLGLGFAVRSKAPDGAVVSDSEVVRICLEHRKAEFRTLADGLAGLSLSDLDQLQVHLDSLPSPKSCNGPKALLDRVPFPEKPEDLMAVQRLRQYVAKASFAIGQTHTEQARRILDTIESQIHDVDFAPLNAEFFLQRGHQLYYESELDKSALAYERSFVEGIRGSRFQIAAQSKLWAIFIRYYLQNEPLPVEEELRKAQALIVAGGSTAVDKQLLARTEAIVAHVQGNEKRCLERFQTSMDYARQLSGPESGAMGRAIHDLAIAYGHNGQLKQAKEHYQEALRLFVKNFGPTYRYIPWVYSGLSRIMVETGKLKQSIQYANLGWKNCRDGGLSGVECATRRVDVARALLEAGDYPQADQALQSLLNAEQNKVRARQPQYPTIYTEYSKVLLAQGEWSQAEQNARWGIQNLMLTEHPNPRALNQAKLTWVNIATYSRQYDEMAEEILRADFGEERCIALATTLRFESRRARHELALAAYRALRDEPRCQLMSPRARIEIAIALSEAYRQQDDLDAAFEILSEEVEASQNSIGLEPHVNAGLWLQLAALWIDFGYLGMAEESLIVAQRKLRSAHAQALDKLKYAYLRVKIAAGRRSWADPTLRQNYERRLAEAVMHYEKAVPADSVIMLRVQDCLRLARGEASSCGRQSWAASEFSLH